MREIDMEARRMRFRERVLAATDIPHLYYQPPESKKLSYPCLIYSLGGAGTIHADNLPYRTALKYDLLLIDKDPDSRYVGRLLGMARCHFDRPYTADNLNHWTFTAYE